MIKAKGYVVSSEDFGTELEVSLDEDGDLLIVSDDGAIYNFTADEGHDLVRALQGVLSHAPGKLDLHDDDFDFGI